MSGLKVLACIVKANSEIKGIPAAISFCWFLAEKDVSSNFSRCQ
jgi:hypothetical protein